MGWDLLERLHAEAATSGIPAPIVSTLPHLIERAQGQGARFGGDAYFAQPVDLDTTLDQIAGSIEPA